MRLVDVDTLEIKSFNGNNIPDYAILSHTWENDEITYQEMNWINRVKSLSTSLSRQDSFDTQETTHDSPSALMLATMEMIMRGNWNPDAGLLSYTEESLLSRQGFVKIVQAARVARNLGYQYVWIDTCCIDKSSSAELQESINSMYQWYKDAGICLVYLADVDSRIPDSQDYGEASEVLTSAFSSSRWITRGWTLQELVAPSAVRFYFHDWTLMGDKSEFIEELSNVTGIPIFVLENGDLNEVSIAERMSWACYRETTRTEDIAYCLLGLFDIQMPLLYGEGEKAFLRLQEEILKTTDDYSIFSWRAVTSNNSTYRGLLARSPIEFRDCGTIERENTTSTFPIHSTPIGIRIQLEMLPDPFDSSRFLAMIRSSNSISQRLAIRLKRLGADNQYARVDVGNLVAVDDWPSWLPRTIYVRQKLSIPQSFSTQEFRCFHIRRRVIDRSIPPVRITSAFPPENWNPGTQELLIPPSEAETFGVLLLRGHSSSYGNSTTFQVLFGFSKETKHYWCKAVDFELPECAEGEEREGWRERVRSMLPIELFDKASGSDARHDIFVIGESGMGVNVSIRAGLCGDSVALQVLIDGLVKGG